MAKKHLCYDEWSGRYFKSTISDLEHACVQLSAMQFRSGDVCVNDYYELLGLTPIPPGYDNGWAGELMDVRISSIITPKGAPALVVAFAPAPKAAIRAC